MDSQLTKVEEQEGIKLWSKYVSEQLKHSIDQLEVMPSHIDREVLIRSGYAENFPQQVVQNNGIYRTPAACFHVYERHAQLDSNKPISALIEASCERSESQQSLSEYRRKKFTMLEYVYLSNEASVQGKRHELKNEMTDFFKKVGLSVSVTPATDAFFLGDNSGARMMQKLKELKLEFCFESKNGSIALASLNYHEDYFGERFRIMKNNVPVHSLCLAFGLERLSVAATETWGTINNWPIR